MTKLKTVQIKGKEYVEVNTRIKYFRQNFKDWSLTSEVIELTNESVLIKATIKNPEGRIIASGYAHEEKASSYINTTSFIENCETSAWGRALGNLGIGIDSSVASYEEVKTAIQKQETQTPKKAKQGAKVLTPTDTDRWSKAVEYAFKNGCDKLFSIYELSPQDKKLMSEEVLYKGLEYAKKNGIDSLDGLGFTDEDIQAIIQKIYNEQNDYSYTGDDVGFRENDNPLSTSSFVPYKDR